MNRKLWNSRPIFDRPIKAGFSYGEACFVDILLAERPGVNTPSCALSQSGIVLAERVKKY
jgi:hypothetical protein